MLWRNQWLQDGEEVVGHNNFGVISFEWPQNNEEAKAVIQDNYWRPPWKPTSVVYSRYVVPLHVGDISPASYARSFNPHELIFLVTSISGISPTI
jgi:hypothetical protein